MMINASKSKQLLKRFAQAGRLAVHTTRDGVRFWHHAALSTFDCGQGQLEARIMYNVHALEKGLAQSTDWQPGRGRKALGDLNDALVLYRHHGFDEASFAFIEGLSVIQRYREQHVDHQDAIAFLPQIVDPAFFAPPDPAQYGAAGTKVIRRADKISNSERTFYELCQARSSVREFSGLAVDPARVMRALEHAEKTPSVCNRQGWRVYWTEDKELASRVLAYQRGFRGPLMPEVLLTVTVSDNTFVSPVERNQGFIDGGLYAMSVLYGLEAEGLAAVALNACLYSTARTAVYRLLEIDRSEEIIMFIAIGDHPEESVVPISDRRPTSAYLRMRGKRP